MMIVRSGQELEVTPYIRDFAAMCRKSPEYQGHGWGLATLRNGRWKIRRSIVPIWEDRLDGFPRSKMLCIHARSAFRNEGICVENNMPFSDGKSVFLFNGELRGVRLRSTGRIGAEKIYNFIRRLDRGDLASAFRRGVSIVEERTEALRAMNVLMTDGRKIYLSSRFSENPDYFQMATRHGTHEVFCSQPLKASQDWLPLPNGTIQVS